SLILLIEHFIKCLAKIRFKTLNGIKLNITLQQNFCFFFQAEDGIRDGHVTGVQTCALPISRSSWAGEGRSVRSPRCPWRTRRARSEERRVGKECRSRWSSYHLKKK